jgi:hypothetical protein
MISVFAGMVGDGRSVCGVQFGGLKGAFCVVCFASRLY